VSEATMQMRNVSSGNLRAIGYDESSRVLRIEFTGGSVVDYANVSADTWRRFSSSGAMGSFFRDNIEEQYSERRVR
jgi:hypothetical protein